LLHPTAINPVYIENCAIAPGSCIQAINDNPNCALLFSGGKRYADAHTISGNPLHRFGSFA